MSKFFCPAGSPSGLPEIIGYLNGTSIQHLFSIKTFLGTFVSCMLAVASGLFCGLEGPMIHLGAILGCGLSQLQSDTLGIHLPFFTRFRNSADKRSFITAGAGAGIASVFRAPIGGLLFTLEEVSSFWDIRLAWQTFFCCLTATFTTDLLSSSLHGFVYRGHFGFFEAEKRILFWVKNLLDMHVLAFIPAILLGMLGGLLGALFVSLNIKINKLRMQFFNSIPKPSLSKTSKLLETVLILVEITNDVQSLLLIMLAVMVAKMVGDFFSASLYSSLLRLKCIPYLDVEPFVHHRRERLNLELFSARDVMEPHVRVLHLRENIASLAWLLASTSHGGFPVVGRPKPDHAQVFQGTIKRLELCMLLENEHIFEPETSNESFSFSHPLTYEKITVEKLPKPSRLAVLLNRYTTDPRYQQLFINLEPYINKSAMSVQAHFSLQRTYIIFRTLGLRHLTVVDLQNRVVGVITRKDLMPLPLEERLRLQLSPQSPDAGE
uniref:Chloride channel protein n=1 Tax=Gallus gallus TaxID=9031 RepID=A0A8V0XP60_CHICK